MAGESGLRTQRWSVTIQRSARSIASRGSRRGCGSRRLAAGTSAGMTSSEQDRLRETAGGDLEALLAETAAGNVDAGSAGPDAAVFVDDDKSDGRDREGDEG